MDNDEHGIERYWAGLEADLKATGCIPQHVTYLKSYFLLGAVAGLSMAGTNLRAIKAAFPDAKTVDAMVGCVALMRNRVEALALYTNRLKWTIASVTNSTQRKGRGESMNKSTGRLVKEAQATVDMLDTLIREDHVKQYAKVWAAQRRDTLSDAINDVVGNPKHPMETED